MAKFLIKSPPKIKSANNTNNVVKEVINYGPDEVILMPLYPQYSAATSGSSINEWREICKKNNFEVKTCTLCCYPTDDNFIQAHKDEIVKKIKNLDNFKKS